MKEILQINDANLETIQTSFRNIASQLMNNYKLQIADKYFRVIECEFYYHSANHPDPYVHGHQRQKETLGEWYFHGSGLDITLADSKGFGGILIRGISEVNKELIYPEKKASFIGPLNVCTAIFSSIGNVLSEKKLEFGFHYIGKDPMGALMKSTKVFPVKRIGLNQQKDNEHRFAERPYRFISFLYLPHRDTEKIKSQLVDEPHRQLSLEEYNRLRDRKNYH